MWVWAGVHSAKGLKDAATEETPQAHRVLPSYTYIAMYKLYAYAHVHVYGVHLSTCTSMYLSMYLSINMPAHISVHMSICSENNLCM